MTALLVDSGIDTTRDLHALLPAELRERITPDVLKPAPIASALRVLATIHDPYWREYVHVEQSDREAWVHVEWKPLLEWARQRPDGPANSVRVRLEIAASLAGFPGAHVQLQYAARVMERHNYEALLDALRIAVEGVRP